MVSPGEERRAPSTPTLTSSVTIPTVVPTNYADVPPQYFMRAWNSLCCGANNVSCDILVHTTSVSHLGIVLPVLIVYYLPVTCHHKSTLRCLTPTYSVLETGELDVDTKKT